MAWWKRRIYQNDRPKRKVMKARQKTVSKKNSYSKKANSTVANIHISNLPSKEVNILKKRPGLGYSEPYNFRPSSKHPVTQP